MKRKKNTLLCGVLAATMLFGIGCGDKKPTPTPEVDPAAAAWEAMTEQERTVTMLSATDDFARTFTLSGGADRDKYVGMFFFTLHGEMPRGEIYNVSEINRDDEKAFFTHAAAQSEGTAYFWGKPVWDYYAQRDPWVIRKQLEMLTMAGVDFLFIDVTNAFTDSTNRDQMTLLFEQSTRAVMEIVHEYLGKGWRAPRLMFYTNNNGTNGTRNVACQLPNDDINVVKAIYEKFYKYKDGVYDDVWFAPHGKPLIVMTEESHTILRLADEDDAPLEYEIANYFDFTYTIWPNDRTEDPADLKKNTFPWMEKYFDGNYLKNRGGTVNVSVAQHMNTIRFSDTDKNYGRGYDFAAQAQSHTASNWGDGSHVYYHTAANNKSARQAEAINYEFLWRKVVDARDAVDMVTVTGWNEWTASVSKTLGGTPTAPFLVDCYDEEYSRDIEPSYGESKDNTYLQTARNIRDYKFTVPVKIGYPAATIDIDSFDAAAWQSGKKYLDFTGECISRSCFGWSTGKAQLLTDESNNNDIESVTVLHDDTYVYFRIAAVEDIKAAKAGNETAWMNVLLQTQTGGKGFDFVLDRTRVAGTCSIEKIGANGYERVGDAKMTMQGKYLQIAVPRASLGLTADVPKFSFKVCDNTVGDDEILQYYNRGDAAPVGRLCYVYGA